MKAPMLSFEEVFNIGDCVHRQSWGRHPHGGRRCMKPWTAHQFDLEDKIGRGFFGSVYRGRYNGKGLVALKLFNKHDVRRNAKNGGRALELLKREIFIHTSVMHRHVVSCWGFYETSQNLLIVMDYAPYGDLCHLMERYDGDRLTLARLVISQVASALVYLQDRHIAHRDIKPENLLVMGSRHVALTDFGWACRWKSFHYRRTLCGTPEYVPPEMLEANCKYNAAYVDAWAMGVLCYEIVLGATPFSVDDNETSSCKNAIFDKIRQFRELVNSSEPWEEFCAHLMVVEPLQRSTIAEAAYHPFLRVAEEEEKVLTMPCCSLLQPSTTAVAVTPL